MRHLDLLGTELKSEFFCDLFETYDTQVVYEYDRTHEGLADEYHANIPELGLQFIFDARQVLRTLFMLPVNSTTFNPFDPDEKRLPVFGSELEALRHADINGLQYSQGAVEFMGKQRDWIRFESRENSIHYEFVDSKLNMITLQSGDA